MKFGSNIFVLRLIWINLTQTAADMLQFTSAAATSDQGAD